MKQGESKAGKKRSRKEEVKQHIPSDWDLETDPPEGTVRAWTDGTEQTHTRGTYSITKIKHTVTTVMWTSRNRRYLFITGGQSAASIAFNCIQLRISCAPTDQMRCYLLWPVGGLSS